MMVCSTKEVVLEMEKNRLRYILEVKIGRFNDGLKGIRENRNLG